MIPAGGSGKLIAKVATHANQSGHLTKSVTVETDEEGVQPLRLRLAFTVQPLVVVEPAHAAVDVVVGEDASTTVTVRRTDGKPLEVGAITSDPPGIVEASAKPAGKGAPVDQRTVVIKATPQPRATVRVVSLGIATNVEEDPVVRYPVAVRIHPVLEVEPRQVRFIVGGPGQTLSKVGVRLIDNRKREFQVRSVESSNPEFFVARAEEGATTTSEHRLTIELAPKLGVEQVPGVVRGEVTVKTDDPAEPQITIPVFLARATTGGGLPTPRPQRMNVRPPSPTPPPPLVPYRGGSR